MAVKKKTSWRQGLSAFDRQTESQNQITPADIMKYLRGLQLALGSSRMEILMEDQPAEVQNKYSLLRMDVRLLVSELTIARLKQVANKLTEHNVELKKRGKALKKSIVDLASARQVLTSLDKFVSLVSRIAIFLL